MGRNTFIYTRSNNNSPDALLAHLLLSGPRRGVSRLESPAQISRHHSFVGRHVKSPAPGIQAGRSPGYSRSLSPSNLTSLSAADMMPGCNSKPRTASASAKRQPSCGRPRAQSADVGPCPGRQRSGNVAPRTARGVFSKSVARGRGSS